VCAALTPSCTCLLPCDQHTTPLSPVLIPLLVILTSGVIPEGLLRSQAADTEPAAGTITVVRPGDQKHVILDGPCPMMHAVPGRSCSARPLQTQQQPQTRNRRMLYTACWVTTSTCTLTHSRYFL
jgi:hypothetical protein